MVRMKKNNKQQEILESEGDVQLEGQSQQEKEEEGLKEDATEEMELEKLYGKEINYKDENEDGSDELETKRERGSSGITRRSLKIKPNLDFSRRKRLTESDKRRMGMIREKEHEKD